MEESYEKDRTHFLKMQLQQLLKCKNSLSQITFVINHNPDEDVNYKRFVKNLPKKVNGVPLVVLRRENVGMMFGVWLHICETYGEEFDCHFVTEDDYVPTFDNFDQIFLSQMSEKCGFVCPKAMPTSVRFWKPCFDSWPEFLEDTKPNSEPNQRPIFVPTGCVIGLLSNEAVHCLLDKYGKDLYEYCKADYEIVDRGLIFCALHANGYSVKRLTGCYRTTFLDADRKFDTYGDKGPLILAPTLFVERNI